MSELIETLASYVPTLITRRLAADPTPITEPASEQFPAAVLFADISGFTALTERLARRGPAGAEEITHLLNTYFGQLINLITLHGGDIVKFAGDALIALWPAGDEAGLPAATLRAAQCGLIIQQYLDAYEIITEARLSLRLALGAGQILTMHLGGGFGRWEFLVTGAPILQVGSVDEYARPGDLVLSPEAWELVKNRCTGQPLRLLPSQPKSPGQTPVKQESRQAGLEFKAALLKRVNAPLPPQVTLQPGLPAKAEAGLRAYIPGAILARLAAGQSGWLAELRRVTVIFANLPDLDYTMPLEQAQAVMTALQTALYRYEGSVNKLSVDDKGVTLVAALGLPPLAHEDDPIRGVQAALDMEAALRQMGLRSAIGITTGRAFCGTVGNAQRREYTMIGDVVNLSARLMQAAPGDILCHAATYQAARTHLSFDTLEPLKVKGKAEPVVVYRPRGRKEEDSLQQTELVDRQAERDRLATHLQALRAESSSVIIIEGEAGIGKSCLVADHLRQARAGGVTTLVGGGNAIEKSTPYHAWRPIFRQFFGLERGPDDPAGQRDQVMARLTSEFMPQADRPAAKISPADLEEKALETWGWEELAPLLNAVLPLDWPENELTRQMSGKVRADNTLELLVNLLQQAVEENGQTGRPHLLVLDDAHWLDSASWALTLLVAQRVRPIQLVIVTRPIAEPFPPEYSQLRDAPETELMIMANLPPADTTTLVCQRLGVNGLPKPLARLIQAKSGGNPFFGEELAYALRDAGLINVTNGQCKLAPEAGDLQSLHWPDTVQGVITSRIDRLAPSQQLTLKVASVIGRSFEFDTLHDIHPIDADKPHLVEYLDSLDKLEITELETPEPDLAYIFKQLTIQEVAYNMMLFSQRRALHRAVAEWYETSYADDLSPFYSLLAYHWRGAEVTPKALDYLEKAGEQALHNYANEEATEFFSTAIALAKKQENRAEAAPSSPNEAMQPRLARWEAKLGEAYVNWAKLNEGRAHLERGLALFGKTLPQTKIGLVAGLVNQIWQQLLHRLWPARYVGRQAGRQEVLLEAARAYEGLTAVYYFANETVLTLYAAFRSLNLAEAAGPSPELARGYTSVGAIIGFIPLHRMAELYCRRALEAAHKVDNLSAQTWVFLGTGMYYAGVGRWSKAQHLFGQVIEISERLGDRNRRDDGRGNLAVATYFQGRFAQSARLSDDCYLSAERRGDAHNQAWALRSQVYCLLPQGEFSEALNRLTEIETILSQNPNIVDEALNIDLHGLLALVHLRRNQPDLALTAATKALELIAQTLPSSYLSLPGYAAVAETYLTLWETEQLTFKRSTVRRACCQALRSYARVFPIGRPQAYLWRGLFEWMSGRRYLARKLWAKSLAAAERLAMPYAQGQAHYQIGRHLPLDDPTRTGHLNRAAEIFGSIEAAYDLVKVQQLVGNNEPD